MVDEAIYPIIIQLYQPFPNGGGIINFSKSILIIIIYLKDAREAINVVKWEYRIFWNVAINVRRKNSIFFHSSLFPQLICTIKKIHTTFHPLLSSLKLKLQDQITTTYFKKTCSFFSHNIPTAQSPFCTRLLVLPTINMHRQITSYYYSYPSFSYRFKIKETIYYYVFKNTYKTVLQES